MFIKCLIYLLILVFREDDLSIFKKIMIITSFQNKIKNVFNNYVNKKNLSFKIVCFKNQSQRTLVLRVKKPNDVKKGNV